MAIQSLLIYPSYGYGVDLVVDEIPDSFGDGYDTAAIVGNSAGLLYYKLRFDFLHYGTDQLSVTDPEDSVVKSWPSYLYAFFLRRKLDGEAFNIKYDTEKFNLTLPTTGTSILVKFVDRTLSLDNVTFKLYSTGITLRQYRAAS